MKITTLGLKETNGLPLPILKDAIDAAVEKFLQAGNLVYSPKLTVAIAAQGQAPSHKATFSLEVNTASNYATVTVKEVGPVQRGDKLKGDKVYQHTVTVPKPQKATEAKQTTPPQPTTTPDPVAEALKTRNVPTIASAIREEGESWKNAMQRAVKLLQAS